MTEHPFDVDAFLAEPLTVRVATDGPTVRPMWFQWEDERFWLMSGPWSKLFARVQRDPRIALVVDVCELDAGRIRSVGVSGEVEILPFDIPRGRRMLSRYLGPDEGSWPTEPDDYPAYLTDEVAAGVSWLKLRPRKWIITDRSYGAA